MNRQQAWEVRKEWQEIRSEIIAFALRPRTEGPLPDYGMDEVARLLRAAYRVGNYEQMGAL